MSRLRLLLASLVVALGFALPVLQASPVLAYDVFQRACNGAGGASPCGASNANPIPKVLNGAMSVFTIVGSAVAVIFVMVGGFKYVLSGGDPGEIMNAKNTIIYALIGLVIIVFARVIIGFVVGKLG